MEATHKQRQDVAYKATVSIGLGLVGFFISLCPILVEDSTFQANLTIGFIFPMLITLAWGWRYGLLSATIGLGCQAPWFLWLRSSGYAPLVTVPLFTVWIVWHGWCREHCHGTSNALWHSFAAEIPFRIVDALILYLVYPLILQLNPAPWSSSDAPTAISLASTHLLVGRQFLNAYIVLSVCEVLLNLGFVRHALHLRAHGDEGATSRTVGFATLFGVAYWLGDTLLGLYVFQVGQGTFLDNLILQIGPEEITERIAVLLACSLGGVAASRAIQKQRLLADALTQARRQFQGVFMAAGDAIFVLHEDGRIFEANPAACRLLGYTNEEVVSLNAEDILGLHSLDSHQRTAEALLQHGEVFIEAEYKRKDGTTVPVEVTANRFTLGNETVILTISRDMTARKKAEERLASSERIYREAIGSAMGVPYQLNRKTGTYDFIGAGVEALLGISAERMSREWLLEHTVEGIAVGADDNLDFEEYCNEFRKAHSGVFRADYRIVTDNGVEKWISDTATIICDEHSGDLVCVLGILQDITERMTLASKLAKSEEVYRTTIERALGVPYELDYNSQQYKFIGAGIEELLGIPRDELDQPAFTNMIIDWMPFGDGPPHTPHAYTTDFWSWKTDTWHADVLIQTPSGKQKWLSDVSMPVRDESTGAVTGSLGILQDITERKEIEAALRESERRISTLMENLPGMVYRCRNDTNWTMLFVSEGCETVCGYSPSDLIDNHTISWNDLIVEEDRQVLWDTIQAMVAQERHFAMGYRIVHASGEIRYIVERGVGVFTPDGELIALEGFIEDDTARRKIEQERERLIAELETRNSELERFTYTVSHDLKSPLITIRGFAGMIEQDIVAGEAKRATEDLQRIQTAADRMHQLLDELLRLSRIGRIANPPVAVRLYDIAQEAVAMLSEQIRAKDITIKISPDLPTVYGDEPRLLEVLQNLIENAAKFVGDRQKPYIEVGFRQDNGETVYWVRDNGQGIEKQYHEKVFQLFDKLDPTSEGSGVGLALVKRIVEVHGGRIWVESDGAGTGSTFCFTVPSIGKERADE